MNLKQKLCEFLLNNNLVKENDVIKHSYSNSRLYEWNKRNVEFNDMSPTLDTRCDCLGVVIKENNMNNLRIRKLTPTECFRLMGVKDEDSEKLNHLSNSVKYHLAGDSIVVNVLEAIFKSILIDNPVLDNKPIRLIEFFAGYGSQALALKYLGIPFEHYVTCEWAIKSIDAYKHIHFPNINEDHTDLMDKDDLVDFLYEKGISSNWNEPMKREQIARKNESELREIYNNCAITKNLINIQQVHSNDLDITDRDEYNYILTYSFPCLTEDSLILTKDGYKEYKDLVIGELVLTKSNTWQRISKKFNNGLHKTYYLQGMGFENIHCTSNHQFYVREMYRKGHKRLRCFKEPIFKEVKNITRKDYFGIPVIQEEESFYTTDLDFWYMIGYYLGDGWLSTRGNDIILACNEEKLKKLTNKLDIKKYKYTYNWNGTCYRFRFADKNIYNFIKNYIGNGSFEKRICGEILRLPIKQLSSLLDGYIDSDGCRIGKNIQFSSVNRCLIYGISAIINKVYHRPTSISKNKVSEQKVIQGRTVNQHDWYLLRFKPTDDKQDKAFYENGYIWYPFTKLEIANEEYVYNMEIENDHSYIVQGCISKNCQDLSLAGKGAGMEKGSGTRSGMLWEVERILEECGDELPQLLLMENVPQVAGSKNKEHFDKWINFLESKGYTNKYCMLNAKEVGYPEPIPQNRNRCFMISVLNPKRDIVFPEKTERKMVLKDLLEHNVDEKYYLTDSMINYLENGKYQSSKVSNKLKQTEKGICPTLDTMQGGNRQPFIKIKNATKQGYLEAFVGDGVNISSRMKNQRGNVQKGITQTITTAGGNDRGVVLEEKWADLD